MAVLGDVTVELSLVLGSISLPLREVLKLGRGATVTLGADCDGTSELQAGGRLLARGTVEVAGERVSLRIDELVGRRS